MEPDPKRLPFRLGPEEIDDTEERELEAAQLHRRIGELGQALDMLVLPAWGWFTDSLKERMQQDLDFLTASGRHDDQQDAAARGRVQVYRRIRGLPEELRRKRDTLLEQLRSIEAPEEEGERDA